MDGNLEKITSLEYAPKTRELLCWPKRKFVTVATVVALSPKARADLGKIKSKVL